MKIKINNRDIEVKQDTTIFVACMHSGIKIPTLCGTKFSHEGVCRVCVVEVGGRLMTSCNTKVCEGMEIVTESEKISKARRINLELLWADHAGKCVTCKKNQRCELQNLATEHKIENFHFVPRKEEMTDRENLDLLKDNRSRVVVDESNKCISRTTELCVECRRCINICPTKEFAFNHRAGDTVVGTAFEKPLDCIFCGQCVKNCPTGAITDKNNLQEIIEKLDDLKKMAIALFDPALKTAMSFEQPEIETERKMAGALRAVGFEAVFDLSFGMELFLEKIKAEIKRSRRNNLILSHCPALNLYMQKYFPEFQNNILDIATPDELMAQFVKNEYAQKNKINAEDIAVVSISSCVAKKNKKSDNLDFVITMRELGRIFRQKNIKFAEIEGNEFDRELAPKNRGAEKIVKCGGAAEMIAKDMNIEYIAVSGIENIKKVLIDLKKNRIKTKIIEAMVCPEGCVNGGGQSILTDK